MLLLLFTFSKGISQTHQKSGIYFNNGKLRADSTLSISADKFETWWRAEPNIIEAVRANLTYPSICLRNGVEGHLIVAFDFTGTEIKNIRTLTVSNTYFDKAAIEAIQKSAKTITDVFQFYQSKPKTVGSYYLPLDFDIIDIREEVKKRGAIPIIQSDIPLMWVRPEVDFIRE
jgi:hypothetical protein